METSPNEIATLAERPYALRMTGYEQFVLKKYLADPDQPVHLFDRGVLARLAKRDVLCPDCHTEHQGTCA